MDISVAELVARSITKHSERPAIYARGETLTYGMLGERVAAIRHRLREMGLEHAPRIGIVTGDDIATYTAIVAVMLNGSAYVPLNRKAPVARNVDIVRDAEVSAVLSSSPDELTEAVGVPVLTELSASNVPCEFEWQRPSPGDLAYLLFTSGSTGKPKGVPISHGSLDRFMTMMLQEAGYRFEAEDRFLQMFELTFDLSVISLFLPLCIGASCHVVPDSRVGFVAALKVLQDQRITVALMVPSLLAYVEPYLESMQLPDLRLSMFCGEALQERLVEKWSRVVDNRPIHNWYGPTEATIFCLRYEWDAQVSPDEAVNGIVPIGRPIGDTSAWLIDDSGNRIDATDTKGELVLGGQQLADGYWRNPEKTAEAFLRDDGSARPLGYRTGDVCYRNEKGDFVYCGRRDAQVKIDGHRVELGEIEHAVRTATGRSAVTVVPVPEGRGTSLVLFLEHPELDLPKLTAELKRRLPAYMLPRHTHYLDRLPLNLNGKFDRPRMREIWASSARAETLLRLS